jgi:maltose-binding protein MalE
LPDGIFEGLGVQPLCGDDRRPKCLPSSTGNPPAQLSEIPEFAKQLKAKDPKVIPIMWDYNVPYFSWPFLSSAGGYAFKKVEGGFDPKDSGVNDPGSVKGLQEIVNLIQRRHPSEGLYIQHHGTKNV